uniref:Ketopantoate reductase C-terminal domain-containing protein n=1 Tax=Coccolithus braarudii TaxID=221442 RepID=A0A7S0L178_9EUKA
MAPRLAAESTVVLLCNGALALAEEITTSGYRGDLLSCTSTHGAWRRPHSAGRDRDVVHAGFGGCWLGALLAADGTRAARIDPQLLALWEPSGLGLILEDETQTSQRLWLKLAANAVLNPLTALWRCRNGEVLTREAGRRIADSVCGELAQLSAACSSAPLSAAELRGFVGTCADDNANNFSSMYADLVAARRSEIGYLNGWACRKASALGVSCAANARLEELVRDVERSGWDCVAHADAAARLETIG